LSWDAPEKNSVEIGVCWLIPALKRRWPLTDTIFYQKSGLTLMPRVVIAIFLIAKITVASGNHVEWQPAGSNAMGAGAESTSCFSIPLLYFKLGAFLAARDRNAG
jgi:hypothetical protein